MDCQVVSQREAVDFIEALRVPTSVASGAMLISVHTRPLANPGAELACHKTLVTAPSIMT